MDKVTFGRYPADRKAEDIKIVKRIDNSRFYGDDGKVYERNCGNYYKIMPLEWRVIERDKNGPLLLCDKIIDIQSYDNDYSDYEHSAIRKWLNGQFTEKAFNDEECDRILISTEDNHTVCYEEGFIEWESQLTGNDTCDKVFLLSVTEIFEKIAAPRERMRTMTDFALDKINHFDDKSRSIAKRLLEYDCYPWQTRTTYIARDKGGNVSMFRQAGIHTGKAKCLQGIQKGRDQLFGIVPAIRIINPDILLN